MRVLWLAVVPSLYDEGKIGGWIGSLENIFRVYKKELEQELNSGSDAGKYGETIDLGIVFEHKDNKKAVKNGVTYYPVNGGFTFQDKVKRFFDVSLTWKKLRPRFMEAVEDFKPDIIQCFGSEWPYGLIVEDVKDIPVVIHIQGFLNIYNPTELMAFNDNDCKIYYKWKLLHRLYYSIRSASKNSEQTLAQEREIMKLTHYFMGRTDWDKNIVKYYGPEDAKYFYCPEAIRPAIYDSPVRWTYDDQEMNSTAVMHIVTITQAGTLKGNEIILRTADFLKNRMGFNFRWRVAGHTAGFERYEFRSGIKHEDVNVELIGMIPAEQVAEELSKAEVYVHPSIMDNSPNSLCEAQLIGTPVIATCSGGIPQLVEDEVTGELYPYNEYQALAFKLMDIHGDKERMEKLSSEEQSAAHIRHDPEKLGRRVIDIYKGVLKASETSQ